MNSPQDGLVLLDKPVGRTSFESLHTIKNRLRTKKVGHAGTLDKFARGLLIVLTGRCTRMVAYLMPLDKEYVGVIRFGEETDTLDVEGELVRSGPVPPVERIREILPRFVGGIDQVPPAFSAVHHDGERAYRLARKGESPALEARRVRIDGIDVLSYRPPDLTVRVRCSKGTYIRALARDIGRDCGSCAHLIGLERTRIGPFSLDEAVAPEEFDADSDLMASSEFVGRLPSLEVREVTDRAAAAVRHGQTLADDAFERPPRDDGQFALFTRNGEFLALVRRETGRYRYLGVFA